MAKAYGGHRRAAASGDARPASGSPARLAEVARIPPSEAVRRSMRSNRRTDTLPELRLRSELHRRGLRFRKDHPLNVDGIRVRPDIVFTRARVAVFIDGCFWHSCPVHREVPRANRSFWEGKFARTAERDARVNHALEQAGWLVLRIWEHEDPVVAAAAVAAVLTRAADRSHRLGR